MGWCFCNLLADRVQTKFVGAPGITLQERFKRLPVEAQTGCNLSSAPTSSEISIAPESQAEAGRRAYVDRKNRRQKNYRVVDRHVLLAGEVHSSLTIRPSGAVL
jgi:hypothetical protein